jgi:hypothetical protein
MLVTPTGGDVVRAVARHGLGPRENNCPVVVSDWDRVLAAIVEQRCTGLAVAAWADGRLDLDETQRDELFDRHEEQLTLDLRVEGMLLRCARLLDDARIECRVLKGPGIAHRFYDDPALRSFGDGDLLVRRTDFRRAIDTLMTHGFARRMASPRRSFDDFIKAVCLVASDGMQLDLHQTLAPGPFGIRVNTDALFEGSDSVALGGSRFACLDREHSFVHACMHAALGDRSPRLVALRDVAQIYASGVDDSAVIGAFVAAQAAGVARRAVELVEDVLNFSFVGPFGDWTHAYTPTRRDRWQLATYATGSERYRAQAVATMWMLPTLRKRASFALALAFPDRRYLAERDGAYSRRAFRGVSLVTRWRPR